VKYPWVHSQFNFCSDLTSPLQDHNLYLTLITFLFSYAYEARSTQQDFNPESAWTISILTPASAALDPPPYENPAGPPNTSLQPPNFSPSELVATLVPCYRRSLAFPLYRSFALAEACHADVVDFLLKGQRTVIRCFLEMKRVLDHHEVYYVYSKIWVDDFCVWLQTHARSVTLVFYLVYIRRE
jgi:protein SHQ1